MKKKTIYSASAVLAAITAVILGVGINVRSLNFEKKVQKDLVASVNYDKVFIAMVDRLEDRLSEMAGFTYEGGEDPMTGRVRKVAPRAIRPVRKSAEPETTGNGLVVQDTVEKDLVKLTAIIFDEKSRDYTAIIMDDERSFSVGVGDRVKNRRIRSISDSNIIMEDDSLVYLYHISGARKTRPR